ncbi:hypothetical protein ACJX0J_039490, partial [Zea mays]
FFEEVKRTFFSSSVISIFLVFSVFLAICLLAIFSRSIPGFLYYYHFFLIFMIPPCLNNNQYVDTLQIHISITIVIVGREGLIIDCLEGIAKTGRINFSRILHDMRVLWAW